MPSQPWGGGRSRGPRYRLATQVWVRAERTAAFHATERCARMRPIDWNAAVFRGSDVSGVLVGRSLGTSNERASSRFSDACFALAKDECTQSARASEPRPEGRLRPASRHDRFQRGQAAGRCDSVDALRDEFEQQSVKRRADRGSGDATRSRSPRAARRLRLAREFLLASCRIVRTHAQQAGS